MAALIFACMKDYGYLHSGPFLPEVIIASIKMGVPGIGEYIQSRMKPSQHMPQPNQKPLRTDNKI